MEYPKVLVVGINPWIDNTGINTLINFFESWDSSQLAHIYTRERLPNTNICNTFFRISESKVSRSMFKRRIKTGERVYNTPENMSSYKEKSYSKKGYFFKQLIREFVWKFGKWKTKELDTFLKDSNPDVLFFPVYSNVYMCRLQNYIARCLKKPIILYSSDDNYSYKAVPKEPCALIHRFWLRRQEKRLFKRADKVMVITPKQKEEYDKYFGINCEILTKGIDFSRHPFKPTLVKNPIKMVYTGKLIIGRWKSLALIVDALEDINKDGIKLELDIYTTDILTTVQKSVLNRNGCQVKGCLTLAQVQQIQKEADILVFVESIERKYKNVARLSFSTKITDYLRSGKCIFAIGDKDIAPMDYFKRYDAAITATSYLEIVEMLQKLIDNPEMILKYGEKGYMCGKSYHDKLIIDKKLRETILQMSAGEK